MHKTIEQIIKTIDVEVFLNFRKNIPAISRSLLSSNQIPRGRVILGGLLLPLMK